MNQQSRNRVLVTLCAVLLITNVVLLWMYFRMSKPAEAPKTPGFTERLKNDVGFTPQQMAIFEPKKKAFWASMRQRFDTIKSTKESFYRFMYDPTVADSTLEQRAELIGDQQKNLDLFVVRHFKDVRKLCTPDQLPKYDSLLPRIIERMTERPGRK